MDVVTLSAYATVIIVLKELVEFVFTKNLPWLSRLVRNGVRRVKRLEVIDVPMGTIAEDENFLKIAILKVDGIDLLPDEWQTFSLVAIPSGYSPLWSALLAEIHGRLGHFPDVVRLRPAPQGEKEKFEVAEILDLRDVRHQARDKR